MKPRWLRPAPRLEKVEQSLARIVLASIGAKVYDFSQGRATRQTPGIPDLYVMLPLGAQCAVKAFWWEMKREKRGNVEQRSPAQLDFAHDCKMRGIGYGYGTEPDLLRYLESLGVVRVLPSGGFQHGPGLPPVPMDTPRHPPVSMDAPRFPPVPPPPRGKGTSIERPK